MSCVIFSFLHKPFPLSMVNNGRGAMAETVFTNHMVLLVSPPLTNLHNLVSLFTVSR